MPSPYYEHGGIVIYHGDCREILPGIEADVVVTDPPYAVSVKGGRIRSHTLSGGSNGTRSLDFFPGDDDWVGMRRRVVEAMRLACQSVSSLYAWCGHRLFGDINEVLESAGFSTRPLVWRKLSAAPAPPGQWTSSIELCVYGYREGAHRSSGYRENVLEAQTMRPGQPEKNGHPTQKPQVVIEPLIHASSLRGDLILDPFMGSGTTLRAAKDLGRKAIGIEIEEKYCEIAANRLAQEVLPFA